MTGKSISDASDQTLVIAVRNGDQRSATELYDRYARRAFGLVHAQMSNWLATVTEPDDIVQSVFKSVFRGVTSGKYEAPEGNTLWSLIAVIAVQIVLPAGHPDIAQTLTNLGLMLNRICLDDGVGLVNSSRGIIFAGESAAARGEPAQFFEAAGQSARQLKQQLNQYR